MANKTGKTKLPLTIVELINVQDTQVPLYSDGSLNIHDVLLDDFSFLDAIDAHDLKNLSLTNCGLKEIPDLSRFNELEDLFLDHNEIRELSNVNGLESLIYLDLSHNNVKIIENMDMLKNLKNLGIDNNKLSSTSGLEGCPNVEGIDFYANDILFIEGLENCQKIERIDISNNKIASLSGLNNCVSLQEIHASDNAIQSLEGLDALDQLFLIEMPHNKLESLDGFPWYLKNRKSALGIDASFNEITSITVPDQQPYTTWIDILDLRCNKITDISWLEKVRSCDRIDLSFNLISSVPSIPSNIKSLQVGSLLLYNNPLDARSQALLEQYKSSKNAIYLGTLDSPRQISL